MNSDYIKIEEHENLVKDKKSGAILSINQSGRDKYFEQKKLARNKRLQAEKTEERIDIIEQQINSLDEKMDMILNLLQGKNK